MNDKTTNDKTTNEENMNAQSFYVNAWFAQGISFDNQNKFEEAIEAYRQVLRLKPEYADAWYNLGISYGNLKNTV